MISANPVNMRFEVNQYLNSETQLAVKKNLNRKISSRVIPERQ